MNSLHYPHPLSHHPGCRRHCLKRSHFRDGETSLDTTSFTKQDHYSQIRDIPFLYHGLVLFLALMCIFLGLALFGSGDLIMNYATKFRIVFIPEAEIPVRMLLAFAAAIWSMTVVASLAFLFSTLAENSIGPIIGTMAVVIVFLVLGNFPFDFFRMLSPYLFTTYMIFWQRFLDDPIPWQEIARSALILGLHNIGLFLIAFRSLQRERT